MARKARKGRLGIYVALSGAILFLVWFGIGFTRPYAKAAVMAAENDRLERSQMELRIKQQNLRKNAVAADTEPGMEREARHLGYVKQGESPLVIPDPSAARRR